MTTKAMLEGFLGRNVESINASVLASPDMTAPEACHLLDMDLYLASQAMQNDIAQGPDMSEAEAFDLINNDSWKANF